MVDGRSAQTSSVTLVERIVRGDRSAEEQLVIEFGPRIHALVIARTGRSTDAQDLTQDVLLAVLQALRRDQLNDASKLQAYILGTARNVVSNYLRTSRPQSVGTEDVKAPRTSWPDWTSEFLERRMLVRKAMNVLSAPDQSILELTLVRGLKPGEIAVQMGLSKDVVRQRKSRALKRIRDRLRELSQNIG